MEMGTALWDRLMRPWDRWRQLRYWRRHQRRLAEWPDRRPPRIVTVCTYPGEDGVTYYRAELQSPESPPGSVSASMPSTHSLAEAVGMLVLGSAPALGLEFVADNAGDERRLSFAALGLAGWD